MSADTQAIIEDKALLKQLGMTKLLGCGGEGCAFQTKRGTVVKLHAHCGSVTSQLSEALTAQLFMKWKGRHPCIPVIHRVGRIEEYCAMVFIEREGLNEVPIPDADSRAFYFAATNSGALHRFIRDPKRAKAALLAWPDRMKTRGGLRYARDMVSALVWLVKQGLEPGDLDVTRNWGVRADGALAIRDFGRVYVNFSNKRAALEPYRLRDERREYEAYEDLPLITS